MKSDSIVLVDYGRGNLRSVAKALEYCGAHVRITQSASDINRAHTLVVPGVGAFGDCMASLDRLKLSEPIRAHVRSGKRFLGICLGLQLLFEESEESPGVPGLGLVPGRVVKFTPHAAEEKVPHMGWNTLQITQPEHPMWRGIDNGSAVYFVHSYYAVPQDPALTAARCDYAGRFCAAVATETLFACQFHPEKSQAVGLHVLKNFIEWK